MVSSSVQQIFNKHSSLEIIEKATKYITTLDEHIREADCEHCKALLREIYSRAD